MANPLIVDCPKEVWTKVATDVVTGQVHKKSEEPELYLHTYRLTGEAAPTIRTEGVEIFIYENLSENISALAGIDVYVMPIGEDGKVRVDL
jgi:hypothetical protein